MSWIDAHDGNLDESGSTDIAEDSHDAREAENVNIFGTNDTNFKYNSSTDYFGSIDDEASLNYFGSLQPEEPCVFHSFFIVEKNSLTL